jgi:hypothetical protein
MTKITDDLINQTGKALDLVLNGGEGHPQTLLWFAIVMEGRDETKSRIVSNMKVNQSLIDSLRLIADQLEEGITVNWHGGTQ